MPLDEYHRAAREMTNGNPDVYKQLYSRRDDVTLAKSLRSSRSRRSEISLTLDRAAEHCRDGEVVEFKNLSTVITPTWVMCDVTNPTPVGCRAWYVESSSGGGQ